MFDSCEICGNESWTLAYEGVIRSGSFGSYVQNGKIGLCKDCGVERLAEYLSIDAKAYETKEYRQSLDQGLMVDDFFLHADPVQIFHLAAAYPYSWRGKVVADIGCGAGSFLDHIASLTKQIIAVEPTQMYHDSLKSRGYEVYNYAEDASKAIPESIDFAVTFQVIEHVLNPVQFIKDIMRIVKPGGSLLIATPNRNDILMKLLPEEFPPFFYRVAHRWYFDGQSLRKSVEQAGFNIEFERFLHTMTMSNLLSWLKDRKPTGNIPRLQGINSAADSLWKTYLETTGQADTILIQVRKPLS